MRKTARFIIVLTILLACFGAAAETLHAQGMRERITGNVCSPSLGLNGVYRIDVNGSDRLYSVIEEATSNVPYGEQQQFFIDLAVRLTPPDLLAIECRGNRVSLGSSRAPRVEFVADGITRTVRATDGSLLRSRIGLERSSLTFNSSGGGSSDNVSFTFTPLENGRRLRVTRRISAAELTEPVVIQTFYDKINPVVSWDIYGAQPLDNRVAKQTGEEEKPGTNFAARTRISSRDANNEADTLRRSLSRWIDATNARNIERQMAFYMPELKAFYLSRNASRSVVRQEKSRAFAAAKSIDIRAENPEIVFQNGGRMAIMRFRKKYNIDNGARSRSGEVIQELRWQQTAGGWKIFSERDIKVLR
ncbi:MAG: nuclear transport factor 2 family protein [Acidobacteriota bacterium]|nr:nuclear transport factor 2 family protein [Acidobacteriota bacterium]